MKIITGIFLMFVCSLPSISQNVNDFEFIGTITVKGGEKLSYKIVFNQVKDNNIKGYSITDLYGENLTKTLIEGKYDTVNNVLSFNELSNTYTKVDAADSTFCFVSAKKLKIKNINGSKIITGEFKGMFPSGEECAEGKIFLAESKVIKKIQSAVDSIKIHQDSIDTVHDSVNVKVFNKQQKMVLMSNDELLIKYLGTDLTLEIWDGAIPDNDKISIYLNDEIFKENITLTNNKKMFNLPAGEDKFKLKIVALNLGNAGVNTVTFAVKDTVDVKEFSSRLNTGETFDIEFSKE
jgi:hypothetical protein